MNDFTQNLADDPAISFVDTLVIGGGPAGLTAAHELLECDPERLVGVFEANKIVGGISRTEQHNGFRVDIGGHRFFTKVPEVSAMWHKVLGDDFIRVQRKSRIYYRKRFYDYPLKIINALVNIGPYESMRILLSYFKWQVRPYRKEQSFEEWVINRFGGRLYMHFFRSYTEKVWGVSPKVIRADWAAQRIKNLSLSKAVWNALSGANDTSSLIEEFEYPRLGPGMMWEKTADRIHDMGGTVKTGVWVKRLEREGNRITAAVIDDGEGEQRVTANNFINSMDLRSLIQCITPPPPKEVLNAAARLRFRDFLIVALVLDNEEPFPDNWIYVHSSDVKVGRIQNFRAWSREMVPNSTQSSIGMEYFCFDDDDLWKMDDKELVAMAAAELELLTLGNKSDVSDGFVIRQPKAYPVYDTEYMDALEVISGWIKTLENFQTVGRNGQHRYNNQDHSMLTAMYAARNILGANYDVWHVNVDRAYHEEFQRDDDKASPSLKTG